MALPDDILRHILNRPWSHRDVWLVCRGTFEVCIARGLPGCLVDGVLHCRLDASALAPAPEVPDVDADGQTIFLGADGRTLVMTAEASEEGGYVTVGGLLETAVPSVARTVCRRFADETVRCNAYLLDGTLLDEATEDHGDCLLEVRAA